MQKMMNMQNAFAQTDGGGKLDYSDMHAMYYNFNNKNQKFSYETKKDKAAELAQQEELQQGY